MGVKKRMWFRWWLKKRGGYGPRWHVAYVLLDSYTLQGKRLTKEVMAEFIKETCGSIPKEDLDRLLALSPETYIGNADVQAKEILAHIRALEA